MEKMANAITNDRIRDRWKKIQKIKVCNHIKPGNVDGHVNEEDSYFGYNIII